MSHSHQHHHHHHDRRRHDEEGYSSPGGGIGSEMIDEIKNVIQSWENMVSELKPEMFIRDPSLGILFENLNTNIENLHDCSNRFEKHQDRIQHKMLKF